MSKKRHPEIGNETARQAHLAADRIERFLQELSGRRAVAAPEAEIIPLPEREA